MIEGLRDGTQSLIETGLSKIDSNVFESVYLYHYGRILDEVYSKNNGILLYLRMFPYISKINQKTNWAKSKRLVFGSLIVLTNPDLKEFVFAIVQSQNWRKNEKKFTQEYIDVLIKGIGSDQLSIREMGSKLDLNNLLVLESRSYFESYYHFLTAIQKIDPEEIPFKSQIIDMEFNNRPPSYLSDPYYNISEKSFKNLKTPLRSFNIDYPPKNNQLEKLLDESQFKALQSILKNELSVIQGPPGTGKRLN